jgi:hypothetical protein
LETRTRSVVITSSRQARVISRVAISFVQKKRKRKRMLTGPTRASDVTRKEGRGRNKRPNM